MRDYQGITLRFWQIYDLEDDYDFAYVEYSTDGGANWTTAAIYNGENPSPTWAQEEISLPALDGQANARIRFRLDTDTNTIKDGWHIDDIEIWGGGLACLPLPPQASFTLFLPLLIHE